jgi:hypothetical protein
VTARASTDDFHDPPGAEDDVLFEGAVDAWFDETRRRVSGIGAGGAVVSDVFVERTLDIDPISVPIEEGHTVTFDTFDDPTPRTGVVQAIEHPKHPHVLNVMMPIRLTLEVQ